ncbi:chromosome segregation protein SMC [Hartmannibacter diazotrophicus]|uniref:Chromosome segregation protein SMC n=1 Tax=Hartmannibacter diazotrophicus TaxID=1482074 RepID=A0A2C9D134_9HYPH|nr:hypothetical protein [Hartmannibacter diazotrophicus]SON53878.1 chromosome segregation protein SMC [Hartmannibacter diazotrophicus]
MADQNDGGRKGTGGSTGKGGRTPKRSTTIDLTAEEVARDAKAAAEAKTEETATETAATSPSPSEQAIEAGISKPDEKPEPAVAETASAEPAPTETAAAEAEKSEPAEATSATPEEPKAASEEPKAPESGSESKRTSERATERPKAHYLETPPPAPRTSPATALIAACIGGVIVLGGAYGLGRAGLLPGLTPTVDVSGKADVAAIDDLKSQFSALDSRIGDVAAGPDEATAKRIADLESALTDAKAAIEATGTAASEQARQALDKLSASLQSLSDQIGTEKTEREALAGRLTGSINDVETAIAAAKEAAGQTAASLKTLTDEVATLPKKDFGPDVQTLTSRVDAFGTRLSLIDDTVSDLSSSTAGLREAQEKLAKTEEAINGRLDGLDKRIGEMADAAKALGEKADGTAASLADFTAKTGDSLASLEDKAASAASGLTDVNEKIGSMDSRVAAVEAILARAPEEGEIAALSLAVTTLAGKVERGAPFEADLAAVKASAKDLPGIDVLDGFAKTGVPTKLAIINSFPADAVIASDVVGPDASASERLFAGAKALVNFRETGPAASNAVGPLTGEIASALKTGDLAAAKATWDRLPEPAKAASADWEKGLEARVAADNAIAGLTDRMIERLSVTVNKN